MQLTYSNIWILWDMLAVGIVLHYAGKCAKKGAVLTITGLLSRAVAIIAAIATYKTLAGYLYENFVRSSVLQALTRSFSGIAGSVKSGEDIFQSMPTLLRVIAGLKRVEIGSVKLADAADMAEAVIDIALREPLTLIINCISFLLIFTAVLYIAVCVEGLFKGVGNIPIIGWADKSLGGIAGAAMGVLMLFVSSYVLRALITVSGGTWWWLNSEVIEKTHIWRIFY